MPTVARVLTVIHAMAWRGLALGFDSAVPSRDKKGGSEVASSAALLPLLSSRSCICITW